jgi:hypothetical protein
MIYGFCNNNARDLLKKNRNQDEGNRKKRKFEGKVIAITGASSGIGRQAALDFVNEGAGSIILIARSESKLLELKRTLQVVNDSKRAVQKRLNNFGETQYRYVHFYLVHAKFEHYCVICCIDFHILSFQSFKCSFEPPFKKIRPLFSHLM